MLLSFIYFVCVHFLSPGFISYWKMVLDHLWVGNFILFIRCMWERGFFNSFDSFLLVAQHHVFGSQTVNQILPAALFLPPATHPLPVSYRGPWSSLSHLLVSLPWCTEGLNGLSQFCLIANELLFPPPGTVNTNSSKRRGCFSCSTLQSWWRALEVSERCRHFHVLCSWL